MVRHQAVTQDSRAISDRVPGEQVKVESAIGLREKYLLAVVAALRDVMCNAGDDDVRAPGHTWKWEGGDLGSQEKCVGKNASVPSRDGDLNPHFFSRVEK